RQRRISRGPLGAENRSQPLRAAGKLIKHTAFPGLRNLSRRGCGGASLFGLNDEFLDDRLRAWIVRGHVLRLEVTPKGVGHFNPEDAIRGHSQSLLNERLPTNRDVPSVPGHIAFRSWQREDANVRCI